MDAVDGRARHLQRWFAARAPSGRAPFDAASTRTRDEAAPRMRRFDVDGIAGAAGRRHRSCRTGQSVSILQQGEISQLLPLG